MRRPRVCRNAMLWYNATPRVPRVRVVWTRNEKQQPSCCMSSGNQGMQESNICSVAHSYGRSFSKFEPNTPCEGRVETLPIPVLLINPAAPQTHPHTLPRFH